MLGRESTAKPNLVHALKELKSEVEPRSVTQDRIDAAPRTYRGLILVNPSLNRGDLEGRTARKARALRAALDLCAMFRGMTMRLLEIWIHVLKILRLKSQGPRSSVVRRLLRGLLPALDTFEEPKGKRFLREE